MHTKTLFWISFFLLLFCPSWPLLFFAPYIVACSYRFGLMPTLWRTLGVSLLVNFFSSSEGFGLIALSYSLSSLLLFVHIRTFFADNWSTLPLMTYLFSLYSSLFYFLLFPIFGQSFCLTPRVMITEILLSPLSDALLAAIVLLIMQSRKKVIS